MTDDLGRNWFEMNCASEAHATAATDRNVFSVYRMSCSRLFSEKPFCDPEESDCEHAEDDPDWRYADKIISVKDADSVKYTESNSVELKAEHLVSGETFPESLEEQLDGIRDSVLNTIKSAWTEAFEREYGEREGVSSGAIENGRVKIAERKMEETEDWKALLIALDPIFILGGYEAAGEREFTLMRVLDSDDDQWKDLRCAYRAAYGDLVTIDRVAFCGRLDYNMKNDDEIRRLVIKLILNGKPVPKKQGDRKYFCRKMIAGLIAAGASAGDGSASEGAVWWPGRDS